MKTPAHWQRPYSPGELGSVLHNEVEPWRNQSPTDFWCLDVRSAQIMVSGHTDGPNGWSAVESPEPALSLLEVAPFLDPLIRTLASDVMLVIARRPASEWTDSLTRLRSWPHHRVRRVTRNCRHFDGRAQRVTTISKVLGVTWDVLGFAASALPARLRPDLATVLWPALVQQVESMATQDLRAGASLPGDQSFVDLWSRREA